MTLHILRRRRACPLDPGQTRYRFRDAPGRI